MNKITLTFFSICCCCLSLTVIAQELLSPEAYVKADIEARRVTLNGMEARLALIQKSANITEQSRLAEETRQNVEAVFARYGVTGASHAAYGTRHLKAIFAWLEVHPDEWQEQYNNLVVRFDALSSQFDNLSNRR